ncbi:hypothetical protein TNCV_570901 [Trichonephila clavipes]|nr:hypothetical protein TNCV_570901 [Trichonephila clavipes]
MRFAPQDHHLPRKRAFTTFRYARVCPVRSLSRVVSPRLFACAKQSSTRAVSFIPLMYVDLLSRGTDILFDPGSNFLKSKAATLRRILMAALTGQTICSLIPADVRVRRYPLKKDLNIGTQAI